MLVCATTSFTLMPVPDALCIIFACPVVTILLSAAVLGDSLNPPKLAAALLLFSGVALVCRPPFIFGAHAQPAPGSGYYLGAALAVTACVAQGVACVLVARCREVATPVLAAWSSAAGLVLGAASCVLDQRTPLVSTQPLQWATLLGRMSPQSASVSTVSLSTLPQDCLCAGWWPSPRSPSPCSSSPPTWCPASAASRWWPPSWSSPSSPAPPPASSPPPAASSSS